MYCGSHFKNCLKWARSKVDDENIMIISAKYGLIPLDKKINYYDIKMGQPGSISLIDLKIQANHFKDEQIISTAGNEYRKMLDQIFKNITYPFKNLSMGYMAQAMKKDQCRN
jgi:hypothetical protein